MSTIGHYEIRELLGEGGIGQVHAAFDTVLEREVAIKSLRPELLSDKSFIDRFRGEAKSLALLNHANITTLYSLLPDGNNLSMVIELVRGDTLDVLLKKREGALTIEESLAIISQAADGLAYAHSMGVIHRDIKPANLMITPAGLLKIMDFGIARVRGSQRLTRDGSMVGTLAYMAPEQLRGEPGDERSDLYSLAIVLYEMLSGAPPFEAKSDYDLMQMHVNARPPRLIGRLPNLSPKVEAALMRALAKKPEQRFESVRAFGDELGATALRVDAPKIVAAGTRLMGRAPTGVLEAPLAKPAASGTFEKVSTVVDSRLHFVPLEWRVPVAIGVATLVVAGGLAAGALTLMSRPNPDASDLPTQQTATMTNPSGPAAPPDVAYRSASIPPTYPPAQPRQTPTVPLTAPTAPQPPANPPAAMARPDQTTKPQTSPPASQPPIAQPQAPPRALASPPASQPQAQPQTQAAGNPGGFNRAEFVAAVERKDFAAAAALNQPAAERGDRDAQFRMGYLNDSTWRNKEHPDDRAAAEWYRKAAEQGHVMAAYNLGKMYEQGRGVDRRSETEAFRWFLKAAEGNDVESQNLVGTMYLNGTGTAKDAYEAVRWLEKAAQQGGAQAMYNLAYMDMSGLGVDHKDEAAALKLMQAAADKSYAPAEAKLGEWSEKGIAGLPKNSETAAGWYRRAVAHGFAKAQESLDRLVSAGQIKQ